MGIYQQFTNDKRPIIAALDQIAHRPGYGMWEVDPPDVFDEKTGSFVPMPLAVWRTPIGYRAAPPPNPLARLVWAIQSLQNAPGRKAIVLFTTGFGAPPSVVEPANRAGVVISVIDPSGMPLSLDTRPTEALTSESQAGSSRAMRLIACLPSRPEVCGSKARPAPA
jgi:hypothetical protein